MVVRAVKRIGQPVSSTAWRTESFRLPVARKRRLKKEKIWME